MSLIEELGLDADHLQWYQLALCEGTDINWFYDLYESDTELAKQVDQMCLSCPVISECYNFAQDNGEYGVWGGLYWNNGKPDRAKNSHKTPEILKKIGEKCL